jgi:hypothetical protein
MAVKDCEQTWSGNAYRRIYPAYRTLVQIAANGQFPPKVLNSQDQNFFLMLSRDLDTDAMQIVWL